MVSPPPLHRPCRLLPVPGAPLYEAQTVSPRISSGLHELGFCSEPGAAVPPALRAGLLPGLQSQSHNWPEAFGCLSFVR